MEKYIGMDIDNKKIIYCVVQHGKKDRYQTIRPDIAAMKGLLRQERMDSSELHLVFEISGQDGRKKIAIVAVCRKMLCIMRAMLRDSEKFNEGLAGRMCDRNKQVKDAA
jgi:hypothetical protein